MMTDNTSYKQNRSAREMRRGTVYTFMCIPCARVTCFRCAPSSMRFDEWGMRTRTFSTTQQPTSSSLCSCINVARNHQAYALHTLEGDQMSSTRDTYVDFNMNRTARETVHSPKVRVQSVVQTFLFMLKWRRVHPAVLSARSNCITHSKTVLSPTTAQPVRLPYRTINGTKGWRNNNTITMFSVQYE